MIQEILEVLRLSRESLWADQESADSFGKRSSHIFCVVVVLLIVSVHGSTSCKTCGIVHTRGGAAAKFPLMHSLMHVAFSRRVKSLVGSYTV